MGSCAGRRPAATRLSYNDTGRVGIVSANPPGRFAPNDVGAMGDYTERYIYDAVGNFLQIKHGRSDAAAPGWTRRYAYNEASLIEPGKQSNRLSSTAVGIAPLKLYGHDAHGNMLSMPQLQIMQWDFKDQLRLTRRQRVNDNDADGIKHEGERTYYVYDASGQRVRKVTELSTGGVKDERIYVGGFEIFRTHGGTVSPAGAGTAILERETLHVMDDKQRIALVETRTLDAAGNDQAPRQLIRYQLGNHLGSASLELETRRRSSPTRNMHPTALRPIRRYEARRRRRSGIDTRGRSGTRIVYLDPWPGRSLLAAGNNELNINAQPHGKTGSRWTITADELARCGLAALVRPHQWAQLQGLAYRLPTYSFAAHPSGASTPGGKRAAFRPPIFPLAARSLQLFQGYSRIGWAYRSSSTPTTWCAGLRLLSTRSGLTQQKPARACSHRFCGHWSLYRIGTKLFRSLRRSAHFTLIPRPSPHPSLVDQRTCCHSCETPS